jgi:signal transduction histidine kinase
LKRLTVSLLLVVVLAVIGLGWAIDQWYNIQRAPSEDPSINNYRELGRELVNLIALTGASDATLGVWAERSSAHVQLTPFIDFPVPQHLQASFEQGQPLLLESGNGLSLHYYLPLQETVASFNFPAKMHTTNDSDLRWLLTLLFYFGVIVIVLMWLYPLLSRLDLLRRSARTFGAGDLSIRIPQNTISYISDIEQEFNRMAQKIENLIADNRLLSRGLSHDLRTPLARLRFGLDVMEEESSTDKQIKTLAHLNRDLHAMESLLETLLEFARLEQANIVIKPRTINLQTHVLELVDNFYKDSVTVDIHATNVDAIILADVEYLNMLIHNLLQNAERHGHGKILVTLNANERIVNLSVEDDGPGIPTAERENVLKPFYRANATANTQGHGMGLAIVDRIAQWHKAELALGESEKLGGLKLSVFFPVSR